MAELLRLEIILAAVARHPDGVTTRELRSDLADISTRTLRRRLAQLVEGGRLTKTGKARATRYFPVVVATPVVEITNVMLSTEGAHVQDYVQRPLGGRQPVGYKRELLDNYVPNETEYLAPRVRKQLHHMGRVPLRGQQPSGTYARQILDRLLIDLSWASSRLEGNTYTRLDTERLIRFGQAAAGKDATETQMILNHKAAIEFLIEQSAEGLLFNRYVTLNLHALLADNLLANPDAPGRLRRLSVEISGSVFSPLGLPQVIDECFTQILDTAQAIRDPYEQAFFVMVHLPYLQPFEDVNKRVSRLAANIPLIRNKLCPLSFVDVPERDYIDATLGIYELNRVDMLRDVFIWAYERSCSRYAALRQSLTEPDPLRLRYREALTDAIGGVVRSREPDLAASLQAFAEENIPPADQEAFVELARDILKRLHEGTIARYRIRPSEYEAWRNIHEPGSL